MAGARPGPRHPSMKIDVLTLFPGMFAGPLDESIVKRARDAGKLDLRIHNLRDYTHDRHRTVDDRPFGGGPGMLLKPEPLFEAVEQLKTATTRVILLGPAGRKFTQSIARELAGQEHLLLISGSYEGYDWLPIANGATVKDFFDNHLCNKVDLYLSGHDHNRQWLEPACGVELIVSGAGAKLTDLEGRGSATLYEDDDAPGFVWIELRDRHLTGEFYNSAGDLTFSRQLDKPE